MGLTLQPEIHSAVELRPLVQAVLDENRLCTISTVNEDGTAHVNTAFFCADSEWRMFFISSNRARHSKNVDARPSLAVAVFNSNQDWDDWKTGLQLFGDCAVARGRDARLAAKLYKKRFSAYAKWLHRLGGTVEYGNAPTFFMFVPKSLKVIHEEALGEETFVTISLSRE